MIRGTWHLLRNCGSQSREISRGCQEGKFNGARQKGQTAAPVEIRRRGSQSPRGSHAFCLLLPLAGLAGHGVHVISAMNNAREDGEGEEVGSIVEVEVEDEDRRIKMGCPIIIDHAISRTNTIAFSSQLLAHYHHWH